MQLLEHRTLAVGVGAAILVTGANLTAYAAGGHTLFGGHHAAATTTSRQPTGAHVYEYVVPKHTALPFEFRAKGLPPGRYSVSLSIATRATMDTDPLPVPFCSVGTADLPYSLFAYGAYSQAPIDLSDIAITTGSGLLNARKKGDATSSCSNAQDGNDATVQTYNVAGSRNIVVFTPLSKVTRGKVKRVALETRPRHGGSFR